jgi:deferrochelatase/peroxidase EfeB
MNRLVWVAPDSPEPAWAAGGSYQVVRIIRNFVERWDRTPLQEQQTIIGREKMIGAPLGMTAEQDVPDYAGDPKGERIRLDAHIRLANPRTAESQANLILRRPYNYSRGISKSGQLDMGLLFVCFQADLSNGFLAVQNRLNGEPLEEYIKPVGGGFFFALPGVPARGFYLGQSLMEATELPGDGAHSTPRKPS